MMDPLQALWEMNSDSALTILNAEFMALANHRKAIGAQLKAYAERVRDIETAAVTMVMRANGHRSRRVSTGGDLDIDRADRAQPEQRKRRRRHPGAC